MLNPARIVKLKRALAHRANLDHIGYPPGFRVHAPGVGKPTRKLIADVQTKHHMATTGTFDSKTQAFLLPPPPLTRTERATRRLEHEVGVTEHPPGSNLGPRVEQYQAVIGKWAHGEAWCASFQSWGEVEEGWRGFISAAVAGWAEAARKGTDGLQSIPKYAIRRGDLLCYGPNEHIGRVTRVLIPGVMFRTIEGNTSFDRSGSQSNGGCVAAKTRYAVWVTTAIRLPL